MMARVSTKVEPIDRDVGVLIGELLSPAARSRTLAEFARGALGEADEQNRSVLGRVPPSATFVDGSQGAQLEAVRPDGVIVREYELVGGVLVWIGAQLEAHSPIGRGRDPHPGLYKRSHTLFADGVEVPAGGVVPPAEEYVFLDLTPYARKIEGAGARPPSSAQAPEGVYNMVADLARSRFGNLARIDFTFRAPLGSALLGGSAGNRSDGRVPAIVVHL